VTAPARSTRSSDSVLSINETVRAAQPPALGDACGGNAGDPLAPNPGTFGQGVMGGNGVPGFMGQAGRGVNTGTGNLAFQQHDAQLPGMGGADLGINRSYNSLDLPSGDSPSNRLQPFGPGWSSTLNMQLQSGGSGGPQVHYGDGRVGCFGGPGGASTSPGNFDTLQASDQGGYSQMLTTRQQTRHYFDDDGHLGQIRDRNGHTSTFNYQDSKLASITSQASGSSGAGREFNMQYDDPAHPDYITSITAELNGSQVPLAQYDYQDGMLASVTDARGNTWQYGYTEGPAQQLESVTTPEGRPALEMTYDAQGRVETQRAGTTEQYTISYPNATTRQVTDANGFTTTYEYNQQGQLERVTDALGHSESFGYDPVTFQRTSYMDKLGREWSYQYLDGDLIEARLVSGSLAGWHRSWSYDANHRVKTATDPNGGVTAYEYDSNGNLGSMTNPLGFTRTITYDPTTQQPTAITNYNGETTNRSYDPATGDLLSVTNAEGATVIFKYDGLGRRTEMTDARGFTYLYSYDEQSQLVTGVNGPLGYHEEREYDDDGNLIRATDANGHSTHYEYDDSQNLIRVTDALSRETVYTYTVMNNLETIQDAEGRITRYEYDELYNLDVIHRAEGRPEAATIRYEYDAVGNHIELTDPRGIVTRLDYDDLNRVTHETRNYVDGGPQNADTNLTTEYAYDDNGNRTRMTDPRGIVTTFKYDAGNRLTFQTLNSQTGSPATADTNVLIGFDYDREGNRTKVTDGRGIVTTLEYDGINRRTTITRNVTSSAPPGNIRTEYRYDANDNLIEQEDALGRVTRQEYDDLNRRAATIQNYVAGGPENADTNVRTTYGYDSVGNTTSLTDPRGIVTRLEYDAANQMFRQTQNANAAALSSDPAANVITTFAYDGVGNLTDQTDALGRVTHQVYDGLNRVTERIHNYQPPAQVSNPADVNVREAYTYDGNGNVLTVTDGRGVVTRYEYDAVNRAVTLTQNFVAGGPTNAHTNVVTRYTYDRGNNLTDQTDPLSRVTHFEYDALSRATAQVQNYRPTAAPDHETNVRTAYGYDANGNVTSQTDPLGRVTTYQYDTLNRPTQQTQNAVSGGPQNADTNVTTAYTYDLLGNLLTQTDPEGVVTRYEYDALNRPTTQVQNEVGGAAADAQTNVRTTYGYDAASNTVTITNPRGVITRYEHDGLNRVVARTENHQPGASATVDTNVVTRYGYDKVGNLLDQTDAAGTITHHKYDGLNRVVAQTLNFRAGVTPANDVNVTTRYAYDRAGNTIRLTDPRHFATRYDYDALNRVTAQVQNEVSGVGQNGRTNVTTRYEYDGLGNLLRLTNANGHATSYAYDSLYRAITQTDAENHTDRYAYDAASNLLAWTDRRGHNTGYTYDALNRVTIVTNALGGTDQMAYDRVGNQLAWTDANGHTTSYAYDRLYRTVTVTDAEGHATRYAYDANSNQTEMVDGNQHATRYGYDPLDRLVHQTNAENETTRYGYDAVGNTRTLTEADNVVTRYGYDGLYRLNAVTLNYRPTGTVNHQTNVTYAYAYDPNGNLTATTDPLNHTTKFAYDELNRMIRETNPLNATWDYTYDGVGNLLTRLDGNDHLTSYRYYPDNQLQTIAYDDGTSVAYSYDPNDNVTRMVDALGTSAWAYDPLNRVTKATDSLGRALRYDYDAVGNLLTLHYPEGGPVQYGYYDNNWLESVTDPSGFVTTYTRDGVGQMVTRDNPNETVTSARYDRADRLLALENRADDGDVLSTFRYTYDDVGLRTRADFQYGWRQPSTYSETYTHDPLRRLTNLTDSEGYTETYQYDAASNRTRWQANDDRATNTPRDGFTVSYTYNAADNLTRAVRQATKPNKTTTTTFNYDGNGNRTRKQWNGPPGTPFQGFDYIYDREDRLVRAQAYQTNQRGQRTDREVTRLSYDGNGRRLVKEYDPRTGGGGIKRIEYLFDGLDPVVEYSMWNRQRDEFYRGEAGELLTMRSFPSGQPNQSFWYQQDGRGNIAGVTKASGQSVHNYRYDGYGQIIPERGNFTDPHNHYTFSQKEWDEEMGLYYFGARHYDPEVGLWTTQDEYRGMLSQPISLHRTAYVHDSPITHRDAYGYVLEGLGNWLSDRGDDATNWLSDRGDDAANIASDTWNKVTDTASTIADTFSDGVSDIARKVNEGWKAAKNSVSSAISDVKDTWNSAKNWVRENKDTVTKVGLYAGALAGTAGVCAMTAVVGCFLAGAALWGTAGYGSQVVDNAWQAGGGDHFEWSKEAFTENLDWRRIATDTAIGGLSAGIGKLAIGATGLLARACGSGRLCQIGASGIAGAGEGMAAQAVSNFLQGREITEGLSKAALLGGAISSAVTTGSILRRVDIDVTASRIRGQVGYGSTDLSHQAIQYRQLHNIRGGRNVAVFEYLDNAGQAQTIAGVSIRATGHAERLIGGELNRMGIKPSQVTRIYSELQPCSLPGGYCDDFIRKTYPQADVTYSFGYGNTSNSRQQGMSDLLNAVGEIFKGR
jgi:RHS repeat-associated protein